MQILAHITACLTARLNSKPTSLSHRWHTRPHPWSMCRTWGPLKRSYLFNGEGSYWKFKSNVENDDFQFRCATRNVSKMCKSKPKLNTSFKKMYFFGGGVITRSSPNRKGAREWIDRYFSCNFRHPCLQRCTFSEILLIVWKTFRMISTHAPGE